MFMIALKNNLSSIYAYILSVDKVIHIPVHQINLQ